MRRCNVWQIRITLHVSLFVYRMEIGMPVRTCTIINKASLETELRLCKTCRPYFSQVHPSCKTSVNFQATKSPQNNTVRVHCNKCHPQWRNISCVREVYSFHSLQKLKELHDFRDKNAAGWKKKTTHYVDTGRTSRSVLLRGLVILQLHLSRKTKFVLSKIQLCWVAVCGLLTAAQYHAYKIGQHSFLHRFHTRY